MKLEVIGIEPITLCMQNTCSSQLSHTPSCISIHAYVKANSPPNIINTLNYIEGVDYLMEMAGSAPASIGITDLLKWINDKYD